MTNKKVQTRLESDSTQFRRDMVEAGNIGDAQLKRLENATDKSARGMQVLGKETGATAGSAHDLSGRVGPLDRILSGIGPKALAAAGALAAASAAATAIYTAISSATNFATDIADQADALGITTESLQTVRIAAQEAGKDIGTVEQGLETFRQRSLQAAQGVGEFHKALKNQAPDILKAIEQEETLEGKLTAYIEALKAFPNAQDQAILAQIAFGDAGGAVIATLGAQEGGLDALAVKYTEAGLIITDETIRMGAEVERQWDEMMQKLSIRFKSFVLETMQALGGLRENSFEVVTQQAMSQQEAALDRLEERRAKAEAALLKAETGGASERAVQQAKNRLSDLDRSLGTAREKLISIQDTYFEIVARGVNNLDPLPNTTAPRRISGANTDTGAAARANAEATERARLERLTAQILLQQNDATLAIALKTEEINALNRAGLLNDEQTLAAIKQATAQIEAQTPLARELAQLEAQRLRDLEAYNRARQQAADAAWDEFAAVEARAKAETDAFNARWSGPEGMRAADLDELDRLIGQDRAFGTGGINPAAQEAAINAISEAYERALEQASRFRDTQYEIERGLWDMIEGSASFGEVWRRVVKEAIYEGLGLEDMIRNLARSFRKMLEGGFGGAGGGAGGGIFGQLFGGLFGGGFGGGASTGSSDIGVFHTGGRVGAPSMTRRFNPMTGMQIGSDERLIIAQKDEHVLTPDQMAGMGGSSIVMHNDFRGADPGSEARIMGQLALMQQQMRAMAKAQPKLAVAAVRSSQLRRGAP